MAVRIRITWNNYELSYYNRILNLTFSFFFLKSNFGDNPFRENSFFPPLLIYFDSSWFVEKKILRGLRVIYSTSIDNRKNSLLSKLDVFQPLFQDSRFFQF